LYSPTAVLRIPDGIADPKNQQAIFQLAPLTFTAEVTAQGRRL
jgi:hypothetical protein